MIDSLLQGVCIIDGFTISNGQTDDDADLDVYFNHGGGLIAYSPVDVNNCNFTQNFARSGAGISILGSNTAFSNFTNCTFTENAASSQSGGLQLNNTSDVAVLNCNFINNQTSRGAL